MKKTILLSFLWLAVSLTGVHAQEKDEILKSTEKHVERMDSIQREMSRYLLEKMKKVVSTDTLDSQKMKNIVENYENMWDYHLLIETERLKKDLGIREKDDDSEIRNIIVGIVSKKKSAEPVKKDTACESKSRKMRLTFHMNFRYGQNMLDRMPATLADSTSYHFWRSNYFSFGFVFAKSLDKKNRFKLRFGIHFLYTYLAPDNKNFKHLVDSNDQLVFTPVNAGVKRNKLMTMYYQVPLGLEVKLSRKWVLAAEAYAKFYGGSNQNMKYKDSYAEYEVKEMRYFNQNKFLWGGQVYLGRKKLKLYFGTDFAPMFKDFDSRLYNVGIGF